MPFFEKELDAVDKAATHAVDLVQTFADQDPSDPTSCWQNPAKMYEQLDHARSRAMEAWEHLEQVKATSDAKNQQGGAEQQPQDLRAQFMDMVTDAFSSVLEEMKDAENIDLDVLVDCLQSGMEILSQEDKDFFLMEDNNNAMEDDGMPSPHEKRRQELGFVHVETTA